MSVVSVTPTLDTNAYATGDCLHTTVMTFTNVFSAPWRSGTTGSFTGWLDKLVVVDNDVQSAAGELWLFNATVTPAAANAAHSISDGDAAKCIGVVSFGTYYASALNSVSVAKAVNLPISSTDGNLYGIAVTRGSPTYTASGLVFTLHSTVD